MKLSLYSQILNKKHLKLGTQFWYLASSMNGPWLNRLPLPVHKHFSLTVSEDIAVCVCVCVCVWCGHARVLSHFSHIQLFVTLWTIVRQAPLSMGFSRQEYWSELPFPPPGDLPDPGTEPTFFMSAYVGRWVITSATWKAPRIQQYISYIISSTVLDHRVTQIVGWAKQQFGYGS